MDINLVLDPKDINVQIGTEGDINLTLDNEPINVEIKSAFSKFSQLTDTPSYSGNAGLFLKLNDDEDALEFSEALTAESDPVWISEKGNYYTKTEVDDLLDEVEPVWGSITGTLSNQADLQAALDLKASDSSFQAHVGDNTIHFTESTISHTNIQDIGSNTHLQIDSHIADDSIHFSDLSGFDTGDLSEGTNLYYTQARFNTAFSNKTTDDLAEGSTNLYDQEVSLTAGDDISITGSYPNFTISSTATGVTEFVNLTDTPATYSGQGLKGVRVNSGETALEFYETAGGTDELVKYNSDDSSAGYLADKTVAGTGISLAENADKLEITNSAPDQTVSISGDSDISVGGTYPNFTLSFDNGSGFITDLSGFDTDDLSEGATNKYDQTVVLNNGSGISVSGSYPNFTITNSDLGSSAVATHELTYDHTLIATALQDVSGEDHSTLSNLDYASSGHTGFEPTVTKGDLTESTSNVLTIVGGTGAVIGSGSSIQIQLASPSDSDTTHLSTADQIYDFVTGQGYLTGITGESIHSLSDVGASDYTNRNVLVADGDSWESRALVKADISDLYGDEEKVKKIENNIILNSFRIAVNGSLSPFQMQDGVVDEYEDETGIDTVSSSNQVFFSAESAYSNSIDLSNGLVSQWKMNDDAANTTVVDTQGVNNGTLTGGNNTEDLQTAGKVNGSLDFDGSNDYVDCGNDSSLIFGENDSFTYCAWIYFNGTVGWDGIIYHDTGAKSNGYFGVSNTGKLAGGMGDGSTWDTRISTQSIPQNTWCHVMMEVDRANDRIRLFYNNTEVLDEAFTSVPNSPTASLKIGQGGSSGERFDGQIDDVRIYNRILSSTEKSDIYNSGNGNEGITGTTLDMTLISENTEAETTPTQSKLVILEEDVDAVTLNTDLKAWVSRDDDTTYSQVTLTDEGDFDTNKRILVGDVDISGQPSDKTMRYKITTHNTKGLMIHGAAMLWD